MTDSGGSKAFLRDGVPVTSPVLSDGNADYTPAISERRSSTTTFYHGGIKNGDSQSNTSESVTASVQYDAFGNVTSSSGAWQGPFAYGGPYGYQTDPDSGLKLLGHRYYDPSTGRFLTRDPVKDGRNWYGYCEGGPLANCDDGGLQVRQVTEQEKTRMKVAMGFYMYHEGVTFISLKVVVDPGLGGAMWKRNVLHISPTLLETPYEWSTRTGNLRKKLQLADFEDKAWLASVIAHELDHVYHNETNSIYWWNQRKVENRAWRKQIEFLEKLRDSYVGDSERQGRIDNLIERAREGLRANG